VEFGQAREEYVRWVLAAKDLSPHTLRAYRGDFARFEQFVGAATEVGALNKSTLVEFLEDQRASTLAPSSLRRRASSLRGFSRWLADEELIPSDPWIGISVAAGRGRKLPRILPVRELDRLLSFLKRIAGVGPAMPHPGLVRKHPHESTTLLAVALMVSTGVRVHEVVGFQCQDIDLTNRSIRLLGKGRRERAVFLANDWITGLTDAYLEVRDNLDLPHSHLLFNRHCDALTTAAMRSRLAKAARAAGLSRHVTPHMLRHTAATQLIEAGVDIRYIQRLLGHASLSTTEIYTHISDRALKRVVSEADVLGRFADAR